jgi:hypothetical protein
MSGEYHLLSAEQMRRRYGTFYQYSPRVAIEPSRVPQSLQVLIPYAEFWGISDDCQRENLVSGAPPDIQQDLKAAVSLLEEELDTWLAGNEADDPRPSREYVAFSAMRIAADFV